MDTRRKTTSKRLEKRHKKWIESYKLCKIQTL